MRRPIKRLSFSTCKRYIAGDSKTVARYDVSHAGGDGSPVAVVGPPDFNLQPEPFLSLKLH
jgi:hypothetical protein